MMVGLYRFFNYEADKWGEPFALCNNCHKTQPIPQGCSLERIADNPIYVCRSCIKKQKKEKPLE